MITRRIFVIALGAVAISAPLASFAQAPGKLRRIGFLWEREQSDRGHVANLEAFKRGLRELGYMEGKTYTIEHQSAQDDVTRLPTLAAQLVALKVDVIVSTGTPSAIAARSATREIPILITTAANPVGSGLAGTLARPGGNVTGITQGVGHDLYSKRLDLLRQIVPGMRRVGFLYDPNNTGVVGGLKHFEADCRKLELKSLPAPVRNAEDIAAAFDALTRDQAQGLIVSNPSTFGTWRDSIIERAARHRLPAIYVAPNNVEAGGLIAYGPLFSDLYRRAAAYADKIFKGAKPGDLPIEQPNKFELVVNLKSAKALGITIPQSILVSADKVIE
jgi:putative tryptophan/tyrosine transport system substrate-binding protein